MGILFLYLRTLHRLDEDVRNIRNSNIFSPLINRNPNPYPPEEPGTIKVRKIFDIVNLMYIATGGVSHF